jgi:hypothetical protein
MALSIFWGDTSQPKCCFEAAECGGPCQEQVGRWELFPFLAQV